MLTAPPYPPKDYVLKDVNGAQLDTPQFTPDEGPRVTQRSLGLFCAPVEYLEGETPEKIEVQPLSPQVVDLWANKDRASWVLKPGVDDFYLHGMFRKYDVGRDRYDPDLMHKEKVFNRSYKYELVCIEDRRLQLLRDKCEREQRVWRENFENIRAKEDSRRHPPMKVMDCRPPPPFWWKQQNGEGGGHIEVKEVKGETTEARSRWTKEPNLAAISDDDPCKRKFNMQLVGQSFKTEACHFYYTHYPPPDVKFRPQRFS